jgi:hypothetical protein
MGHDGATAQRFLESLEQRLADKLTKEQNERLDMKRLDY